MDLHATGLAVDSIGAGVGINITCNYEVSTNYGNSIFNGLVLRGVSTGGYAIKIHGTKIDNSGPASNFYEFNLMQIIGSDTGTALYLCNTTHSVFTGFDIESVGTGIHLAEGARYNTFIGGLIKTTDYALYIETGANANTFYGINLDEDGTSYGIYNVGTARYLPNKVICCYFDSLGSGDRVLIGNNTDVINTAFVNPFGVIANPWSSYVVSSYYTCRPDGGDVAASSLVSARRYKVIGVDMFVSITGGTVTAIVIEDGANADMLSLSGADIADNGLYLSVPIDCKITVTYSSAPTVVVSGN
jgi:hypothetical protein